MIELGEGDGLLYPDGLPRLVIVTSGATRIPYPADRTISQLYADIARLGTPMVVSSSIQTTEASVSFTSTSSNPDLIEKGDTVTFTGSPIDGEDLTTGTDCHILDLIKQNGVLVGYEIINDAAATPRRISVLASDVILVRKYVPPTKVEGLKEQVFTCACGEQGVAVKGDGVYTGVCSHCGKSYSA